MSESDKITYCADVIAKFGEKFVVIERLGDAPGLALSGGKQEFSLDKSIESLSATALREFGEETGLELTITGVLCTRAKRGRDPRGNYVSTVFIGVAHGIPREERGKTKVLFLSEQEIMTRHFDFVFDHFEIFQSYFSLNVS